MRRDDTLAAVSVVLANPIIGTGIGTNVLALNQERGALGIAVHNVYLEYAVELGIPGLVLFVLLLVECLKSAGRMRRRTAGVPGQQQLFCLAEAIQVSLVAFAVAAVFHPVAYHLFFYYVAGLAVAVKVIGEAEQPLRA
jgi:O-antigen ligase